MPKVSAKRVTQPVTQVNPAGLVGWGYVLERHILGKRQILRHMEEGQFPTAIPKARNRDGTIRTGAHTLWRKDVVDAWFNAQGRERDADLSRLALDPHALDDDQVSDATFAFAERLTGIPKDQLAIGQRLEGSDRLDAFGRAIMPVSLALSRLDAVRSWIVVYALVPALRDWAAEVLLAETGVDPRRDASTAGDKAEALAYDILDQALEDKFVGRK